MPRRSAAAWAMRRGGHGGPPRVPARNCGTRGGRLRAGDGRGRGGSAHPSPGSTTDQSSSSAVHSEGAPSAMEYQAVGTATTVASPVTATLPFGSVTSSPFT